MVECTCLTYGSVDGAAHHVSQRTRYRHLEKDRENAERLQIAHDDEDDFYGEGKPTV
jgi:hypothetical protein